MLDAKCYYKGSGPAPLYYKLLRDVTLGTKPHISFVSTAFLLKGFLFG